MNLAETARILSHSVKRRKKGSSSGGNIGGMGGGSGGARGAGFGGFAGAGAGARKSAAAQACAAAAHAAAGVMKDDSMGMGRVSLAHPSAASCPCCKHVWQTGLLG